MLRLTCALMLSSAMASAADISGVWQLVVETNRGTGSPKMMLQQQGDQITGTISSRVLGESPIAGTVNGNVIEFRFEGELQGQLIKATYKGKIESPTTMKGTAVYEGLDMKATWSATRK
jgi:hypothetical protein